MIGSGKLFRTGLNGFCGEIQLFPRFAACHSRVVFTRDTGGKLRGLILLLPHCCFSGRHYEIADLFSWLSKGDISARRHAQGWATQRLTIRWTRSVVDHLIWTKPTEAGLLSRTYGILPCLREH